MKRIILGMLFLCLCSLAHAGWGKYAVQFSSYVNITTSNDEVKLDGNSASMLGRVIISSGMSGITYLYDSQTSTATDGLITEINTATQETYSFFVWLSSGLTIKNENGAKITLTGNRR